MEYLSGLISKIQIRYSYSKCIGEEAKNIEIINSKVLPFLFPAAYLEFLRKMGSKVYFLRGLDFQVASLDELNQVGRGMVSRHSSELILKDSDFIFLMSQGCAFAFFNLLEGDNPPVYGFVETQAADVFQKISPSFTDFLEKQFEGKNPLNLIQIKGII